MWFKLMTLVHICAAFPLKCPEPTQWTLRANSHCADPSKYFCLRNDLTNVYSENCTRSDFLQGGRKSVLRGGIDAVVCSEERYQPSQYIFYTNASTNCIFLKSFCNEEGQVVYGPGDRNIDATCRCDYRQGYDFLIKPNNSCSCKPSQEDCSCFRKICSNSSHILSPDYKCTIKSDLPSVTHCRAITDENDNSGRKPDVKNTFSKEDDISVLFLEPWKERSVIAILSIFGGTCTLITLVVFIRQFQAFQNNGPEHKLNLIEGDTLTLQYMLPIKRLRLCFFKDNTLIPETVNVKKHVLEKTNVTLKDQGNYFAKVCNIRSRITTVTVQSMFTSDFNTIKCIEGEILQLKCSVYSEEINVELSKVDAKDKQSENISMKVDGKDHSMTIQQAQLNDAGQYMMVAGNVRKQVTVIVAAMFTSEFKPMKCIEGETLQLKCSVYSEDINIEWYKDDTKVKKNKNISIEIDGKDHCMTIQQAQLSDAGQYMMVAGNVQKQVTVTVEDDHSDHQASTKAEELGGQVNELEWMQTHINCDGLKEKITFNSETNCLGPRKILHSGTLCNMKSSKELEGVLCNDFLLLISRLSSSTSEFFFDPKSKSQYEIYEPPIFLNEIMVKRIGDDDDSDSCQFQVSNLDSVYNFKTSSYNRRIYMYIFKTSSNNARENWVKRLDAASRNYIETERKGREKVHNLKRIGGVGRLLVLIESGSELKPRYADGTRNSYCEVQLRIETRNMSKSDKGADKSRDSMIAQTHRTNVIPATLNPVWNQNMQFTIRDVDQDVLCITVFDKNSFSPNSFLGSADIRVKDIFMEYKQIKKPISQRYKLHEVSTGLVSVMLNLELYGGMME